MFHNHDFQIEGIVTDYQRELSTFFQHSLFITLVHLLSNAMFMSRYEVQGLR